MLHHRIIQQKKLRFDFREIIYPQQSEEEKEPPKVIQIIGD
jgi:hypothetical protein